MLSSQLSRRQLLTLGYYCNSRLTSTSTNITINSNNFNEPLPPPIAKIKIPKRIHRSSTDILEALESTIGSANDAYPYKYMDDPIMCPNNNLEMRAFALAKESGRSAARYFLETYPELFLRDDAEPKVEAFTYNEKFEPDMTFTLEDLECSIAKREVMNTKVALNGLHEQGVLIPFEKQLEAFALISFYGGKDETFLIEKNWFGLRDKREPSKKVDEQITNMFENLLKEAPEDKLSDLYSIYVLGLCQNELNEKALQVFKNFKKENPKKYLRESAISELMQFSASMEQKNDIEESWSFKLLKELAESGQQPSLKTFHAMLRKYINSENTKQSIKEVHMLIAEMKSANVKPSLGTYSLLLSIFFKDRNYKSDLLRKVMNVVENRTFEPKSKEDFQFLPFAMGLANENMHDLNIGKAIRKFQIRNPHMLGSSMGENFYYKSYLSLVIKCAPLEKVIEEYDEIVPTYHLPQLDLFIRLLNAIEINEGYEYISKFWEQMIGFGYDRKEAAVLTFSSLLKSYNGDDLEMQKNLALIGTEAMKRFNFASKDRQIFVNVNLSNIKKIYANFLEVFLKAGNIDSVIDTLNMFDEDNSDSIIQLDFTNLTLLTELSKQLLNQASYRKLVYVLNYCKKRDIKGVSNTIKPLIKKTLNFDAERKDYLLDIVSSMEKK